MMRIALIGMALALCVSVATAQEPPAQPTPSPSPTNPPAVADGSAVLSKEADEHAPMLLGVAARILANRGIVLPSSPPGPVVDDKARPTLGFLETQRRLEPLFSPIQARHALSLRQAALASAIAVALLIHHFARHLPPITAFGLAAFAFIEGSKTAPDPVTLDGTSAR